jgi:hypothetical protein
MHMDVAGVLRELENLAASSTERVAGWLDDARQFLADAPDNAVKRTQWACGALGELGSPGAVQDVALRREAWRLRGVANVLAALASSDGAASKRSLDEATRAFAKADAPTGGVVAKQLALLAGSAETAADAVVTLAARLGSPDGGRDVHEAIRPLETRLIHWCKIATSAPLPALQIAKRIDRAVVQVRDFVPEYAPDITRMRDHLVDAAVQRALKEQVPQVASEWLPRRSQPDWVQTATVQEAAKSWQLAADSWETAGRPVDALRCTRVFAPDEHDVARSLRLAREAGDSAVVARLEWAVALVAAASAESSTAAALTTQEAVAVDTLVHAAIEGARHGAETERR